MHAIIFDQPQHHSIALWWLVFVAAAIVGSDAVIDAVTSLAGTYAMSANVP